MKIGGLREDILFESKEYPLMLPKKDCQGGFRISPPDPLETTKGRASALPLETFPGSREISGKRARALRCARLRGTLRRGTKDGDFGACGHSEHPALWETRATMARQISNRHWCCHSEEQSDVGIRIPSSFRRGRCL